MSERKLESEPMPDGQGPAGEAGLVSRPWAPGSVNRPRRVWLIAATLLVAIATFGSFFGASADANNDAQRSKASFVTSSMGIASSLELAIQQENGLAISAQSFALANPEAANDQFLSWIGTMQVAKRFPEVSGLGFVAIVRPGQLSQFVAPMNAQAPGQSFQITPPGTRPYYCLLPSNYINGGPAVPRGYEDTTCARGKAPKFKAALSESTYLPYRAGKKTYLSIETPVFPKGVIPTNFQSDTASALGLVGLTTLPSSELAQALKGHPGTAVAFHYASGSSKATFRAGSAPRRIRHRSTSEDLPTIK